MKNVKMLFIFALAAFTAALSLTTSGCKSTVAEITVEPILEDLFPLVVGRKLTFSGFLRTPQDVNVEATGAFYEARMTIAATNAPTPFGTAHVISDSQLVSPGVWFTQSFYVQRSPATGSGDFGFLTNIGNLYRTFGIQRTDTLRWVLLVKQSSGVGVKWTAFDSSWTGQIQAGVTGTIRLEVEGEIQRQDYTSPTGQTFSQTYYVVAKRKIYLNGVLATEASTAELWLVPNVGIVKFIFHGDGTTGGFHREYKDRNF